MCFRTHTLHLTFSECTGLLYLYMEDTLVVIQEGPYVGLWNDSGLIDPILRGAGGVD